MTVRRKAEHEAEREEGCGEGAGEAQEQARSVEELLGVLESERDKLRAERDEKDQLHLRAAADLENLRKRVSRERPAISAQAKRDLVAAILPSVDALDLAIRHASEDADIGAFLEGVRAARDALEAALATEGIERIPVEGCYDPHLHQVDAAIPSPGHADGAIIEELRAGYRIGDLVARHASVVVAKAPPGIREDQDQPPPGEEEEQ
jgi:molecular chaperone GrpE